ncbi:MAG TPA: DUF6089 family protein [Tenuifilaceae bacterium]|nr:DUF6089 family protein [Tenuifilaceae bacterium]HOZ14568.1 DUF6089 family protein [Tenuifilaceae bacterium]HPI44752.1 DUF6089 family protein [Tenuifilaceae bacterium]HPN21140.1 DUF6089 family protein [Tenuifilaceae bacterium]HPV55585.1 DUF6089 family protein [Tenuifilaceae bacterium]
MKRILTLCLILSIAYSSSSQTWKRHRLEVFVGLPISHYFGDIGGTASSNNLFGLKDVSFRALRPGLSVGAIYRLNQLLYIQASCNFAYLGSSDKGSRNEARNYGFSTYGSEITATALFYIIPESDRNYFYSVMDLRGGLRHINKPLSLYVFAGAGGLFYSVSPKFDLIDSDRFDNSENFTPIIPFGIGMKYQIMPRILLGAEFGARYVLSDYIDGLSPTQSKHNDTYYILNFKVAYRLPYDKFLQKIKRKF